MDIYRCMRKSDLGIKNNYCYTCYTANNDSSWYNHDSMRSNTNVFSSYLYKWTYRIMSDHRNISNIYILSCTSSMRRNYHRDMDSNRCLRKGTYSCNKNHYSNTCTTASVYNTTNRCNSCL